MNYPRTRKQIILYKRLVGYCNQLAVTPIPRIAWSRNEAQELNQKEKRKEAKHNLGCCYNSTPLIYIAYNKHKGLRHLDDTLRHELIHYRFTGIPHGINFQKRMRELKQGKTWNPFNRLEWAKAFNEKWKLRIMEWNFRAFLK